MKLSWDKLLCSETIKEKEKVPSSWTDYPVDPFEQDYREIISSVSFRRLQDKAQVYQLHKGEFVRTRLTHSLEVSTIAKQLGMMLMFNKKWTSVPAFESLTGEQRRAIPTVLACAGLLHDMGNPPFGHEGERAISMYFSSKLNEDSFEFFGKPIRNVLPTQMYRDIASFDGNAQVLRVLSKCRFPSEEQEANVSFASVSTLLKYPVNSVMVDKSSDDTRVHKTGYYLSEEELFHKIRKKTGLDDSGNPLVRNPLTFLLEAADDIAYIASDIEDSIAKSTVSIPQFVSFMKNKCASLSDEGDENYQMQRLTVEGIINNLDSRLGRCQSEREELAALRAWTNYLRNWLMYVAACSFIKHSDEIMDGTYSGDILEDCPHKYTIQFVKNQMVENVYSRLGDIHIAAHGILTDLLSRFVPAVIYYDTEKGVDPISRTYVDMIPARLIEAYNKEKGDDPIYNLYLRFRMVTDFIDSMTDGYALDLYKRYNAFAY